jgi:hypothetical protein
MDAITTAKQISSCTDTNSLEFCTEQARNSINPITPNIDVNKIQDTTNVELLLQQQKAKAQKLLSDQQSEIIEKKNLIIDTLRQSLESQLTIIPNISISSIPPNPKMILMANLARKVKQIQEEIRNKTKSSLSNNVSTFSYPLKPMTPELPNITTPNVSIPNIPKLPLV